VVEFLLRPSRLTAHLVAGSLRAGNPIFSRAIGAGFAGKNLVVGHPVLAVPTMSVVGAADADIAAWKASVFAAGGSVSSARETIVTTLILGLKADGVWAKLDRLWLFAAENTQSALRDLKVRTVATAVNSPAFDTVNFRGYTGNSSSAYIDTGIAVNFGGNYSRNSACFFAWSNTAGGDGGALAGSGLNGTITSYVGIFPQYHGDGNLYSSINFGFNWSMVFAATGATGLYLLNRTAATSATVDQNGVQAGTDIANAAEPLVTTNFQALASNGGFVFSGRQCSCLGFGGSLTVGERAALYSRLRTYMTSVGVP
jgi:hypothetical protein